jgi:diadenosine tetraphosphate (Ap4A) HIT family hydrolase
MSLIYESSSFLVDAPDKPLVDRYDGGHIIITPKVAVRDRQELEPAQAIELMRLTMITGDAMSTIMNQHRVDIGRINYQDNGNWSVFNPGGPHLHIHIYGRARQAKIQRFGQALFFPHRDEFPEYYATLQPLNIGDVIAIGEKIVALLTIEKYKDTSWRLI